MADVKYEYKGDVVDRLLASYQRDKSPFITDSTKHFPERPNGFEEIRMLKMLFFPNYWNNGLVTQPENRHELESQISYLGQLFFDGVEPYLEDQSGITQIVEATLNQLPNIREDLKKDVEAAFTGDPAAEDNAQIIKSYPGFSAVEIQRVAHALYNLGAGSYARELTEHIHSKTGIDIHPGAKIGQYFFIDHGTGVVIGETAEIGDWVRIYQGVTLGVLHFEEDGKGVLRKGYKRHPTVGDHVVVGAGAQVLGPIYVGDYVKIGATSWVAEDIPDGFTVFAEKPKLKKRPNGKK